MPKSYLDKLYHELMYQSCVRSLVKIMFKVRRLKIVMRKIYTHCVKKLFYKKLVEKVMRKSYKYSKSCAAKLSFKVMLKKISSNSYLKNL